MLNKKEVAKIKSMTTEEIIEEKKRREYLIKYFSQKKNELTDYTESFRKNSRNRKSVEIEIRQIDMFLEEDNFYIKIINTELKERNESNNIY